MVYSEYLSSRFESTDKKGHNKESNSLYIYKLGNKITSIQENLLPKVRVFATFSVLVIVFISREVTSATA